MLVVVLAIENIKQSKGGILENQDFIDIENLIDIADIIDKDPLCCWCHDVKKANGNKYRCEHCQELCDKGIIEKDSGKELPIDKTSLQWKVYFGN